ncbi:hypothetical protein V2J09_021157 [Rumex salicifolius]
MHPRTWSVELHQLLRLQYNLPKARTCGPKILLMVVYHSPTTVDASLHNHFSASVVHKYSSNPPLHTKLLQSQFEPRTSRGVEGDETLPIVTALEEEEALTSQPQGPISGSKAKGIMCTTQSMVARLVVWQ